MRKYDLCDEGENKELQEMLFITCDYLEQELGYT